VANVYGGNDLKEKKVLKLERNHPEIPYKTEKYMF